MGPVPLESDLGLGGPPDGGPAHTTPGHARQPLGLAKGPALPNDTEGLRLGLVERRRPHQHVRIGLAELVVGIDPGPQSPRRLRNARLLEEPGVFQRGVEPPGRRGERDALLSRGLVDPDAVLDLPALGFKGKEVSEVPAAGKGVRVERVKCPVGVDVVERRKSEDPAAVLSVDDESHVARSRGLVDRLFDAVHGSQGDFQQLSGGAAGGCGPPAVGVPSFRGLHRLDGLGVRRREENEAVVRHDAAPHDGGRPATTCAVVVDVDVVVDIVVDVVVDSVVALMLLGRHKVHSRRVTDVQEVGEKHNDLFSLEQFSHVLAEEGTFLVRVELRKGLLLRTGRGRAALVRHVAIVRSRSRSR
mmetsp:Transcript_2977/g.8174  ORF Transcript_2977/g.8174 Transcript_2977/m.8174 type:complete len:359 (+) Transcript_2977:1179-2255(+)